MSEYGAITPTTNGLTMITESVVKKKPIVFTKIAIGDGALTNQNIEALTALIRQKQEAPIHIVTDKGAGLADVSAVITNAGLSTGYYARELGVFAKVGDTGQEKLFAYTNAGANASYSPADGSLDEKLITVTFKIGTGATLKVALNSQVYLTLGNLEKHNTSSSAHTDIRRMFNSYLPLTGGTLTGRLYVNDAVFMGTETSQYGNFVERTKAGTMYLASGKSENSNTSWFNIDGYFKYTDTAEMCVIKRDENANILASAYLLDQNNKTRFPGEVYSNEKLLATKEYVDGKKWGSTSITDGAVTPTKLDRPYLPLTGGAVTGRLHVDDLVSTGNNSMQFSNFIQTSLAGKAYLATGKSNSGSWYNIDGYFNNPEQSNIGVLKRNANGDVIARAYLLHNDNKTYFPNEVYANNKLLATKEYVDTKGTNDLNVHNTSNIAHSDIRRMFESYLPLTGGTLTGSLSIDGGNNIVHYIGQGGGTVGGNLNLGDAKKTKSTALCCINRPMWWDNTLARNLALEEDLNTHNASSSAHADIRAKITSDINAHNSSRSAHTLITDQIKAILGGTNWQDNPTATIKEITDKLGFGGVVAQRIGTNGFIKHASGLTIQWGVQKETFETTKDGTEYKCTLPIAFQNKPLIAIGGIQGDDKVNHYTYVNVQHFPANDTNSTVSFYCYRDWDWSSTKFRLAYFTIGV